MNKRTFSSYYRLSLISEVIFGIAIGIFIATYFKLTSNFNLIIIVIILTSLSTLINFINTATFGKNIYKYFNTQK
jgi:hypothetical protein